MDPTFRRLFRTCYLRRVIRKSAGSTEELGPVEEFRGHVEVKRREALDPGGTTLAPFHLIITETPVTMDDRVWLPGSDVTKVPGKKPASVMAFNDPNSGKFDHYEVTL